MDLEQIALNINDFVRRNTTVQECITGSSRIWEDDVAVAVVHVLRKEPRAKWPERIDRFKALASRHLQEVPSKAEITTVGRLTLEWLEDPASFEAYKAKTRPTVPYLGCV